MPTAYHITPKSAGFSDFPKVEDGILKDDATLAFAEEQLAGFLAKLA